MTSPCLVECAKQHIADLPSVQTVYGRVTKVLGLLVEITGITSYLCVGTRVHLMPKGQDSIPCEVVGFAHGAALALPFGALEGVGLGCSVVIVRAAPTIAPCEAWRGRVIDGLARPIDAKGPLPLGMRSVPLRAKPPPPHQRARLGTQLDLGVRAVNCFTAMRRGQRMGIFSGSGVGKSVLLSMMARYTSADVAVIGLVGERGREVQEFLEDDLGPQGLTKAVVVVATGDESALMRRQAAYVTLSVAEYFRDQGHQVLCLIDSLTRFAMAQREIGLSAGEPPTTKGYPPTTFGELARLLERAGPGLSDQGSITGLFSVLVEGDDHNEPISDAVRGMVDGHIVMERSIADRGRYPAINVLASISRAMPAVLPESQRALIRRAKQIITTYEDMAELIRLGAYRKGSDAHVDEALSLYPRLEAFLAQDKEECCTTEEAFAALEAIVDV